MGVGAIVGAGLGLYSSRKQSKSAKSAAKSQSRSAEAGIAEQRAARESFEQRTEPFRKIGLSASLPLLGQLGIDVPQELLDELGLESAPETSFSDVSPLADFLRAEGFEDIQESAAARGRLGAGGTLRDLTQFNTQLAGTLEQQRFNNLFNLLGLGQNAAVGQGSAGLQTASNIGNLLQAQGQAQAAGITGAANAQAQGVAGLSQLLGYGLGGGFSDPRAEPAPIRTSTPTSSGFGASGFQGTFGI